MYRDRSAFEYGVNYRVEALQRASNLAPGVVNYFSLGSPAAVDADIVIVDVDSDAVANTIATVTPVELDGTYGRSLRLTPSADPGNAYILEVYGFDYLGQPMVERFTGANGSTAILYGKKAFKWVSHTKVITPATNAIVTDVGTGFRLGLPYRGDVVWAKENGVLVPVYNRDEIIWLDRAAAKAVAGGTDFIYIDRPGYVKTLLGVPGGGGGATDPVITVELGGVAITGLTVTIDTSDVAGLTVTDVPTTVGYSANNRLRPGDKVEIVAAAAAGAFADRIGIEIASVQFVPAVNTDPNTSVLGDPRGTYEPLLTPDGSEIIVGLIGDTSVNASDRGGLHGIAHAAS